MRPSCAPILVCNVFYNAKRTAQNRKGYFCINILENRSKLSCACWLFLKVVSVCCLCSKNQGFLKNDAVMCKQLIRDLPLKGARDNGHRCLLIDGWYMSHLHLVKHFLHWGISQNSWFSCSTVVSTHPMAWFSVCFLFFVVLSCYWSLRRACVIFF